MRHQVIEPRNDANLGMFRLPGDGAPLVFTDDPIVLAMEDEHWTALRRPRGGEVRFVKLRLIRGSLDRRIGLFETAKRTLSIARRLEAVVPAQRRRAVDHHTANVIQERRDHSTDAVAEDKDLL